MVGYNYGAHSFPIASIKTDTFPSIKLPSKPFSAMRYPRYSQKPSIPLGPRRMIDSISLMGLWNPRSLSNPGLIVSQISSLFKIPTQCASALALPAYVDIASFSPAIGTFLLILLAARHSRSTISQPNEHPGRSVVLPGWLV
jgi:hypothetical protein